MPSRPNAAMLPILWVACRRLDVPVDDVGQGGGEAAVLGRLRPTSLTISEVRERGGHDRINPHRMDSVPCLGRKTGRTWDANAFGIPCVLTTGDIFHTRHEASAKINLSCRPATAINARLAGSVATSASMLLAALPYCEEQGVCPQRRK